ncbi:MAG: hypothetical protein B7Y88_11015 [Sphingomonadales bacterium 32-64-17]|nr:MAG: hypothetical protein B7Y88_11015 [Sphingomonadales bacterium 32-64-17]
MYGRRSSQFPARTAKAASALARSSIAAFEIGGGASVPFAAIAKQIADSPMRRLDIDSIPT